MYSPSLGYIWRNVPILLKLCALIVWLVGGYTLSSACLVLFRIRSAASRAQDQDANSLGHLLAALRTRSANMRQLLGAAFYLFGFSFFLTLPSATITLGDGRLSAVTLMLHNFIIVFYFAAYFVFSVFLVLHFLQWFVSIKISSCAMRLGIYN